MAIEFRCACGALCRAEDDQVGQLFHCEACGVDTPVPSADEAAAGNVEGRGDASDALREQLGGGGAADIAAGLREQGVDGEKADKRREGAEALRDQLGGGGVADLADALQADIMEAEAVEDEYEEPRSHEHDLEDLADQALSEEQKVEAAEEAQRHRVATEALRSQLGGGGHADIAAGLRGPDEGGELAEKRRGDAEALRSQLGGGGFADLAKALRGEDDTVLDAGDGEGGPPGEAAPPGEADSGAPAGTGGPAGLPGREAGTQAGAAPFRPGAAGRRVAPKKKVLRGHERAAHHLGFKRFIWFPSMLVGLVCIAVGVGGAVFHIHPREIPSLMSGKPNLYEQHMAVFREKLKGANISADDFDIVEHAGRAWAIPAGAEHRKTSSGGVYYTNDAGFDEPAVDAEEYVRAQSIETGRVTGLLWYGVGLIGVGGILAILSLFALRDVLIVGARRRKEEAAAEEAEVMEGEAVEDAEAAETGDVAAEGEIAEVAPEEGDEPVSEDGDEAAPPDEGAEVAPEEPPEGEAEKDATD